LRELILAASLSEISEITPTRTRVEPGHEPRLAEVSLTVSLSSSPRDAVLASTPPSSRRSDALQRVPNDEITEFSESVVI